MMLSSGMLNLRKNTCNTTHLGPHKAWSAYPARCAVQERWQALKLSRRNKAAALAVASLCIWMSTGWTLRLQVLLLGALTVRCNLKPAEASSLLWLTPMSHVHICISSYP